MRCKLRSQKHDFGKNVLTPKLHIFIYLSLSPTIKTYIYIYTFFQQKLPSQFILSYYASSSFCLNVVFFVPPKQTNMHDRKQYLRVGSEMSGMRKSTQGVLQVSILVHQRFAWHSRLLFLRILRRWFQVTSNIPSQGHRHSNSTNNRRPEERFFSWSCQNSLLIIALKWHPSNAAKCACISGDMLPHHHHFLCQKKKDFR